MVLVDGGMVLVDGAGQNLALWHQDLPPFSFTQTTPSLAPSLD